MPTWYAAAALLRCGVLAMLIAWTRPRGRGGSRWHWAAVAAALVFMSLDEIAALHAELSGPFVQALRLDATHWMMLEWLLPHTALAIVVAVALWRLVWRLPARTMFLSPARSA